MSDEPDDPDGEVTQLLQFLYACPVGLIEVAVDGTIGMINPLAMGLLLPISQGDPQGGMVDNLFRIIGRYAPELRHIIAAFDATHGTVCNRHRVFVHAGGVNGADDPLVLECTLVKLDDRRLIATLSDISKDIVQERRLKQAETWFATLLDGVNDFAVISLDGDGVIDAVNQAAARQTGYSETALMNRRLDDLDMQENGSASTTAREQMAIARRDGWHLDEGWRNRPVGDRYWCQRLVAARSEDETPGTRKISGYTVVLRDVTRRESDSLKLKELLTTDHLTGACNRAHFFDVAERLRLSSSLQGQTYALIAIDIDHFKRVNDQHGHAAGDIVLRAVTTTCKALLRANDTFARIGGEEFVALLPSADLATAVKLAERLRVAIGTTPLQAGNATLTVTASFGCTVVTDTSASLNDQLVVADQLLYVAKRNGRNRVESVLPDEKTPKRILLELTARG